MENPIDILDTVRELEAAGVPAALAHAQARVLAATSEHERLTARIELAEQKANARMHAMETRLTAKMTELQHELRVVWVVQGLMAAMQVGILTKLFIP